jgi:hypothetical protein
MAKGYILVNFRTKKAVHTFSAPGRKMFDNYIRNGYENVAKFYGHNAGASVNARYNKNRAKGIFA